MVAGQVNGVNIAGGGADTEESQRGGVRIGLVKG